MFTGILGSLKTALLVILEVLGLVKFFSEKKARADDRILGREQSAADAALETSKRKAEEEGHRVEVSKRSDADLDKSLDQFMRD